MSKSNPCKAVWFSANEQELYEKMKTAGKASQKFKDFVKSAFYERIDRVNNAGEIRG